MTIQLEKQVKLKTVFSAMPATAVARLTSVFQAGATSGDTSLPFDILLGLLPPGANEPEPDIDKIFFPISELITENAQRLDQLPYQLLRDIWSFYATEIDPILSKSWQKSPVALNNNRKKLASGLQKAWEEEGGKAALTSKFGEENARRIPFIFSIMLFAEEISELIGTWPDQIKDLDDSYLLPVRDLNDLLAETYPDITPFLLFLLKKRLRSPQHILRAIERLSRQTSDTVIVNTDMYIVVEALLDEAQHLLEEIKAPIETEHRVDEVVELMTRLANILGGSLEEFEISPASIWGKRLFKLTNEAGKFWTHRLKTSWQTIETATPRFRTKTFLGGSLTNLDLRQPLIQSQTDTAILDTYLLAQMFPFSSKIGFSATKDEVANLIEDRLRTNEDNFISLLADSGEVDLDILHNHFSTLVGIKRKYHGEDAANILNRRGIAAAAA